MEVTRTLAAEKQYQLGIGPVIGLGNLGSRDLIQGSLSSRSKNRLLKITHLAGLLYVTTGFISVLLGMEGAALVGTARIGL